MMGETSSLKTYRSRNGCKTETARSIEAVSEVSFRGVLPFISDGRCEIYFGGAEKWISRPSKKRDGLEMTLEVFIVS